MSTMVRKTWNDKYIVACQAHFALVKEVQCWYRLFIFSSLLALIHVYGLKG